jgi:methane/ammonia monooxygenase subunit B
MNMMANTHFNNISADKGKQMLLERLEARAGFPRAAALSIVVAIGMFAALWPTVAAAHGERAEPPFLRMSTVQFYDTRWSAKTIKVNEEMTVSGRFRIVKNWSFSISPPKLAFLNVDVPGPVMVREASYLDGANAIASTPLELGRDYEYKIVMRGRIPGNYHVHPMLDVHDSGALLGPGNWVTVEGNAASFTDPITTLLGDKIDLAHYGLGAVVTWHLIWIVIAAGWLLFWLRRPLLIPRYEKVMHGEGESLISGTDRIVGIGFLVATLLIVAGGVLVTRAEYPVTIPLQSVWMRIPPLPEQPETVSMKVDHVVYYIPGRTVELWVNVTNHGAKPVRVGEFTTAGIRFLNASVSKADPDFPPDLVAPNGLEVEPNDPIQPGESKSLHILMTSEIWETDRLAMLIADPSSRIGGLFMFYDPDGNRSIVEFNSEILPIFKRNETQQTAQASGG